MNCIIGLVLYSEGFVKALYGFGHPDTGVDVLVGALDMIIHSGAGLGYLPVTFLMLPRLKRANAEYILTMRSDVPTAQEDFLPSLKKTSGSFLLILSGKKNKKYYIITPESYSMIQGLIIFFVLFGIAVVYFND